MIENKTRCDRDKDGLVRASKNRRMGQGQLKLHVHQDRRSVVQKILKPRHKLQQQTASLNFSRFFPLGEHHTLPAHRLSFPTRFSLLIPLGAAALFSAFSPTPPSRR